MNIADIKKMDIGVSGMVCSGEIKYTKEPRNIVGDKDGKPYDFWTQFVVVEDSTDSIGANVRIGGKAQKLHKGYRYTLADCKLDSYEKDGETKLALKARVESGNAPQNVPQATGGQKTSGDVDWDAKDLRMARMNALTNATRLVCLMTEVGEKESPDLRLITTLANSIVDYIYNGMKQPGPATPNAAMGGEGYGSEASRRPADEHDRVPDF